MRTDRAKTSFYALKDTVSKPPTLVFPDVNKKFSVYTDASKNALGALLMQKNDKCKLVVVQYASPSLTKSKRICSTFEKEAAAVISALEKYRRHLLGAPFIIYCVQKALQSSFANVNLHGRLSRWLYVIAEYAFQICYVGGKHNVVVDYLSRSVGEEAEDSDEDNKQVMERYFCRYCRQELDTAELIATIELTLI